ncbi:HAUS augmin-like complex subunit 6 [Ammospiza maritima maritima]
MAASTPLSTRLSPKATSTPSTLAPSGAAVEDAEWEKSHLWMCLLALGFDPNLYPGVQLGRDMFATPNGKAFSVIAHFLFVKQDKHRARKTLNLSSPGFRKHCCQWLREISQEMEVSVPQITSSTLISPGGAKVVRVLYCFARYVMIENMKKLSVGTGIPSAEAVMQRSRNMYIAKARHRVAYNKLLQILQREHFIFQEYRRKAQILFRAIKRTKSEYAVAQKQFCRMKQNDQNENDITERIQKVRSMWALIVEMLTSLKKDKEVVNSVLEDYVDPCILDGSDVVLSVPALLTSRVESNIYGFCTGNLYEEGNLNFLTVIQLLNEALMTLRDERCPRKLKELYGIEDVVASYKNALWELNTESLRRKQEYCEPMHQSLLRKQEIWESKWKMILGQCPFNLILRDDLQPALSLQSFSSSDKDGVLNQSFSDNYDYDHEEICEKSDGSLETMIDTILVPSRRSSSVPSSSEASEKEDLLIKNNLNTCVGNEKPVPQKNFKNGKEEFPASEMEENAGENVTQPKSPAKKDNLLEKARDELAEEIAKSVMSESPHSGEEKGMPLHDLNSSLSFYPFITKNQIPRTPENLLAEIRSSWRKAIQTEGSLDPELSSAEVVTEESSVNAPSGMQEEEQVIVSHTFESSNSNTSGIQENERTESEEPDCSALRGSSVEDLSQTLQNVKNMTIYLKSGSRTNTLPSDHCRSFLMGKTLCWNASALNSALHESPDMGILDETLPECDGMDPSISADSDSFFLTMDSENLMDGSENNEDIKKLDLYLQSLSNSHEVLKTTASKTHNNGDKSQSYRAKLRISEEGEENEDDPPTEEGFTKMPLPSSPDESKHSLSSLLVSCQQKDGT